MLPRMCPLSNRQSAVRPSKYTPARCSEDDLCSDKWQIIIIWRFWTVGLPVAPQVKGWAMLNSTKSSLWREKILCLKVSGVAKYYYTRITNPSRFSFNLTPEQTILCIIKKNLRPEQGNLRCHSAHRVMARVRGEVGREVGAVLTRRLTTPENNINAGHDSDMGDYC